MTATTTGNGRLTPTASIVGAWSVLVGLTGCTWWLGGDHDLFGLGRDVVTVLVLVLTFSKIYVVGQAFMELRDAARWLNLTFTTWCVAVCGTLIALYLTR